MAKIDYMSPKTGRVLGENDVVRNVVDAGQPVTGLPFTKAYTINRPANTTAYAAAKLITSGFIVACATTDTSKTVTPASMVGVVVGMAVSGTGVAANSVVETVGTTTITLNNACTATAAAENLTFAMAALPVLDFGVAHANQWLEINEGIIKSSNQAATIKMNPSLLFYNRGDMQASLVDAAAFAPTPVLEAAHGVAVVTDFSTVVTLGANYQARTADSGICKRLQLDAAGKTWFALLDGNAYVPASGEVITVVIKGIWH